MVNPIRLTGQAIAYIMFGAFVGYFSVNPVYTHVDPGTAMVKLSFAHPAQRKGECRRLSPEEIAKLAPNMRRPMECPRERWDVFVELFMDGELLYRAVLPPSGLSRDGASAVYERFLVEPGRHRLAVRLRDSGRSEGFDHQGEIEVTLSARQNFVIDFKPEAGGFIFM